MKCDCYRDIEFTLEIFAKQSRNPIFKLVLLSIQFQSISWQYTEQNVAI